MILKATDVAKTYSKSRKQEAFRLSIDSFEIREGSFAAILGPNGSGKTTFIKIILDLLYADSGKIELLGHDHKNKIARQKLSYLPENFSFPEKFTVRQMLHAFANIGNGPQHDLEGRIQELATAFNVGFLDKKIKGLSKGMTQTAALMHTFLGDYKFFILDEPLNGLDAVQKKAILNYIFELQQRKNISILITTHILSDIEKTCDKLSLIQNGAILHSATKDEINQKFSTVEDYYFNYLDSVNA